ncbi:MAG: excinuclease ABC subunit C [Parcubacteria group bacterium CG10_big_fil_rev_8_21_14_0_10_36_14]|nr:MAG: excinuclease ABC subunit C [Parcubacteria group bacterium CG10_big_fil_rev_8_21_14_0_10_36_14]
MQNKLYYIYILTNNDNKVLYTGITSNLPGRIYQHKSKLADGFTKKYNVDKLIYYEVAETAISAIAREKQIKAGSRKKKIELINKINPEWKNLYNDVL